MEHLELLASIDTNTRIFLFINTTEFNGDGTYEVQSVEISEKELNEETHLLGWDLKEKYPLYTRTQFVSESYIKKLEVGEMVGNYDYDGAYLMRIK